jgi:predicted ABC-type ATPase
MANSKPIEVDILDMEMSQDLPYWLDPVERYKGTHDNARRQKHEAHIAELQAQQKAENKKKAWQRARDEARRRLRGFDPSEPRDEAGRWTDGGGSDDDSGSTGSSSPHAKDPTSASSLLRINPKVTVKDVIARVPGADKQVAEAQAKVDAGTPTDKPVSQGGYKLPNGKWTPERAALHDRIRASILTPEVVAAATPKPGEQPVLHILGGRGGSGKSWFTGPKGTFDKSTSLYLNNDDIKERLGWKGWNAGLLHEESSTVGSEIETAARKAGLNVIIDATLKSDTSTSDRIAAYKAAGYRVEGHYMYASPEKAAERALQRFVRGNAENGKGRFVDPAYSMASTTNEHNFDTNRKNMDAWEVYDNNVDGREPVFHARGGN